MSILTMNTGWFEIDEKEKSFKSIKLASSIEEAWEKTFEKWEWMVKGYNPEQSVSSCGLCNLFHRVNCEDCPVFSFTRIRCCFGTPHERWEKDRKNISFMKEELTFLRKVKEGIKETPLRIVEGGIYEWKAPHVNMKVYLLLTLLSTEMFQLVTLNETSCYWGYATLTMSDVFSDRQGEFRFVGMKMDVLKVLDEQKKEEEDAKSS